MKIPELIPVRSIVFVPFILLTIYIKGVKNKNRKATEFFRFLFFSGQMLMYIAMLDLFLTLENGWGDMGGLVREGFFLSEVVLFVIAGIALRRLPMLFFMTNIGVIMLIVFKFPTVDADISRIFIGDFIGVSAFLSFGSIFQEKLNFKAFVSNEKLKKELHENERLMKKLEVMAKVDTLTGVFTRNAGMERLNIDIEHEGIITFIDVDKLKIINDKFGHDAGDKLLIRTTDTIKNYMSEKDYIIRFGGDEFLLVSPMDEILNVEDKMKLILEELKKEKYSFSYGSVAFERTNEYDIEKLIQIADKKMYEQKFNKRETVVYELN